MYTCSFGCHNQTAKWSKFRRLFQIAAFRILRNKALQVLKETPVVCDKTIFNTTNFHRFHVHLCKLLSQFYDQIAFDCIINTLLHQLVNQNLSLDTLHEQNNTDAEKLKNEVNNIFTQTEFHNSSETEVSPKRNFLAPHECFSDAEHFPHKSAAYYSPMKLDAVDEFSSKIVTLQVVRILWLHLFSRCNCSASGSFCKNDKIQASSTSIVTYDSTS